MAIGHQIGYVNKMENMWLLVAAGLVFFGGVFVYVLFMIFLPEWVGITGKVAKDAEASHQGGKPAGPDFIARIQGEIGRNPADQKKDDQTSKPN